MCVPSYVATCLTIEITTFSDGYPLYTKRKGLNKNINNIGGISDGVPRSWVWHANPPLSPPSTFGENFRGTCLGGLLGAHAKFSKPTTTLSGNYTESSERKRK